MTLKTHMNQLDLIPRVKNQPTPGTVHVPDWLSIDLQNELLGVIRHDTKNSWYTPAMPNGTPMKHPIACLGYRWKPYEYFEPLCKVSGDIILMAIQALEDAELSRYLPYMPDTGIVNYFPVGSSLGMHQDKSESAEMIEAGSPIVTISLGDTAIFRLGNTSHPGSPYQDFELRSGDLLVMSGFSRLAYHSVLKILPDTRPPDVNLPNPGRVSLTLRQVYPLKTPI